jgi:hypothetical protein
VTAVAFHFDPKWRDLWAHLALTFRLDGIYEVGCPPHEATKTWHAVESLDDVPGRRAFLCRPDAQGTQGMVPLFLMEPVDVLVFGEDERHNTFALRPGEQAVYFDTPGHTPLHAVQAAAVVLYEVTRGDHR